MRHRQLQISRIRVAVVFGAHPVGIRRWPPGEKSCARGQQCCANLTYGSDV